MQAENALIDLAPKYMEALMAISKTPDILVHRKEDLTRICENILKTSRSDLVLVESIGILAQIGDQKSIDLLTDYFNDLPPKKWTQRRVGSSIKAGS